ncbi:MAG: hypothetical protein LWX83_11495 [Anaerolineae bacterium]|nr:hypothetical protein [Anaerolineae bacterium]
MAKLWYTYNSQPNKENLLWDQIRHHNLDGYFPQIKVKPVNPRARKIRPYFPGYLFIQVDLKTIGISALQYMPYSKGLVSFGGEPAVVPEVLIKSLQERIAWFEEQEVQKASFKQGDKIEVVEGWLQGYEAIFDATISGKDRSRILIKTLNEYALRVEIDNHQIKRRL